jgi:glycine/D-amino acid oxidase-like deaminating enzyme
MHSAARRRIRRRHRRKPADLKRRVEIWNARGAPLRLLPRDEMEATSGTGAYAGGCLDPRGGAINPLGYARGLARAVMEAGGAIRQKAEVRSIKRARTQWRVMTARGNVDAETVIIGTNAYTGAFWPGLQKTFLPARTPQIVSRPLRDNSPSILPREIVRHARPHGRRAHA